MKNLICFAFFSLLFLDCSAQKDNKSARKIEKFWLVILKTGPQDSVIKDSAARSKLFEGHMSNMGRLHEDGILKAAGPFGKNDFTWRGLFILDCKTIEEAEKYVATDPAIAAGVFVTDIVPWYSQRTGSFTEGKPEKKAE